MSSEIEVDESYFGVRRVRDKRGCGAGCKTCVFTSCHELVPLQERMLKRETSVYTQVALLCQRAVAYHKGLCRA